MAHSRQGSRDEVEDVARPSSVHSATSRESRRSRGNSIGETGMAAMHTNPQRPNTLRGFREPSIRLRRQGGAGGFLSLRDSSAAGVGSAGPSPLAETSTAADLEAHTLGEPVARTISSPYLGGPSSRTRGRSSSEPPLPNVPQVTVTQPGMGLGTLTEESAGGSVPGSSAPVNPRRAAMGLETPDTVSIAGTAPSQIDNRDMDAELVDILDVMGRWSQ
jgi:hypothetical protein